MRSFTARSLVTLLCAVGATASGLVVIGVVVRDGHPPRVINQLLRTWARAWTLPAGVRLSVVGGQNIVRGEQYMVVSNHQSNLDPIVHLVAIPLPLRFLAMRELFDIPVLGSVMRSLGMIEVDRKRPDAPGIRNGVARALGAKASILVYPEGEMTADGIVEDFHAGAFVLAVSHSLPILPVATAGTRRVWAPGSYAIRSARVRVVIGEPISTLGLTGKDVSRLRTQARDWIVSTYARELRGNAPGS